MEPAVPASPSGTGAGLLADVLPAGLAWSESFGDAEPTSGFPEEEAAIARAVPRRQREYRTVRRCARAALGSLGFAPAAILSGPHREPLWPPGIVGSMTHCAGYRGAAVGRSDTVRSVGIDAEPHQPLPPGVLDAVADPAESAQLAELGGRRPEVHWDRLLFCAKEATYKTWFPLARRWLGFHDARVRFDPALRVFTSTLLVEGPALDRGRLELFTGRWVVRDGLVLAAITVPAHPGPALG